MRTTGQRNVMREYKGPLRAIVEVLKPPSEHFDYQLVRLECGHTGHASGAAIYRARCRDCKKATLDTSRQNP